MRETNDHVDEFRVAPDKLQDHGAVDPRTKDGYSSTFCPRSGEEEVDPMIVAAREPAASSITSISDLEWEETNCLLCGSDRSTQLIEAPDNLAGGQGLWFAVARCLDCDLCFTNPRPRFPHIGQFYPKTYWPERAPGPRVGKEPYPRFRRWCRPRRERRILFGHGERRLLDFGCGEGAFLHRMHQQGWNVLGLDAFAPPIEHIRRELALPALQGTLPHPQLSAESFDLITMWHSLEHVYDPRDVLQEAFHLLTPGGKLMVAVPNIDSLAFQWFGRSWIGLDLPRHLIHFSPKTLQWMLERAGFHINSLHMIRQCGWMRRSALLSSRSSTTADFPWRHWLTWKAPCRWAGWLALWNHQCDCMMVTAERPK